MILQQNAALGSSRNEASEPAPQARKNLEACDASLERKGMQLGPGAQNCWYASKCPDSADIKTVYVVNAFFVGLLDMTPQRLLRLTPAEPNWCKQSIAG